MFKLSKKADYGLIALKHLAINSGRGAASAGDIADLYGISAPLMAKVLQKLAREGLLQARHGSSGGYVLAKDPTSITALEAINAIEGPVNITSCRTHRGACEHTDQCTVREPLRRVNDSIMHVLGMVTISQMTEEQGTSGLVELGV
jgi:FeS assembly SUF system regulator